MQLGQLERSLLEDELWSIYLEMSPPKRQPCEATAEHRRFAPATIIRRFPCSEQNQVNQYFGKFPDRVCRYQGHEDLHSYD